MAWTLTLVILNFLHSFGNIIYNSYFKYHSIIENSAWYMFFTALFSGCYVPMVDFLTIITLLYLFYFQGM